LRSGGLAIGLLILLLLSLSSFSASYAAYIKITKINPSDGKAAFYDVLYDWIDNMLVSSEVERDKLEVFIDKVLLRDKTMRAEFKNYLKNLGDNNVLKLISDWEGEDLVALRRAAEGMVEVSQSVKPLKVYDLRYLKAAINNPTYDRGPMKVYDTVSPYTLKQIASLDAHVYGSQASDSLFTNQTTK